MPIMQPWPWCHASSWRRKPRKGMVMVMMMMMYLVAIVHNVQTTQVILNECQFKTCDDDDDSSSSRASSDIRTSTTWSIIMTITMDAIIGLFISCTCYIMYYVIIMSQWGVFHLKKRHGLVQAIQPMLVCHSTPADRPGRVWFRTLQLTLMRSTSCTTPPSFAPQHHHDHHYASSCTFPYRIVLLL